MTTPTLTITDTTINASEASAVGFSVTGIDADVAPSDAIVTFTDSASAVVTALANAGTVNLSTLADGPITTSVTVTDGSGNTETAAGAAITLDATLPTVTINRQSTQADPALDLPVVFDVVFSESVTGFDITDIDLSAGTAAFIGTPTISIAPVTAGLVYTVTVAGDLSAPGTVIASVNAGGAQDAAGNGNVASTSTDNSVTVTGRTVTLVANDTFPLETADNNDVDLTNDAQFEVTISDVSTTDTIVRFTVDPSSTATLGADYTFGNQVTDETGGVYSVVIAAGATSETFDIDIIDDLRFDPDETIILNLTSDNFGTGGFLVLADSVEDTDQMTIVDDETGSVVSVAATDDLAVEGDPLSTTINAGEFTVSVSAPFDDPVTVTLDVTGTADVGSDFTFSEGTFNATDNTLTVTIPAGASSVTIGINPVAENSLVELDETVILTPSSVTGAPDGVTVDGTADTVIIEDDDSAEVTVSTSAPAGVEGGVDASATFTLSTPSSTATTLTFDLSGTATIEDDYDDGSGDLGALTVTIPANTSSVTVPLDIINDDILETSIETVLLDNLAISSGDEDISVSTDPTENSVSLTIQDNDTATVSIEGTSDGDELDPATNGQFVVTLSAAADEDILVPFEVTFNTAGVDFANTDPNIPVGAIDYTFGSEVLGTGTFEDPFRVLIAAGETSAEINILVNDDTVVEIDEIVELTLIDDATLFAPLRGLVGPGGDSQVTIGAATDTITIRDTDSAFVIVNSTIDNAFEGGANGEFTVTLALPGTTSPSTGPITEVVSSSDTVFNYTILPGLTVNPAALNDVDASGTPLTGTFTIPAGQSSTTLDLVALVDGSTEGIEDIVIRIGNGDADPDNDIIDGDSDIQLDPNPNNQMDDIFINDSDAIVVTVTGTPTDGGVQDGEENNGGTTVPGEFTFNLTGAPLEDPTPITVNFTIGGTATVGLDHSLVSGSVVIDPGSLGETSATVSVPVIEDILVEGDETVTLTIDSISFDSPANISHDSTPASIDIIDDDIGTVTIDAIDQFAGEGSTNPAFEPAFDGRFEVQLSNPSATGVVVNYSVILPGPFGTPNATEGSDFTAVPGSVVILPNQTTAFIDINTIDDFSAEGLERVVIRLDSVNNPLFDITTVIGPSDVSSSDPGDLSTVGTELPGDRDFVLILPDQTVSVSTASDGIEGRQAGEFTVSLERPSSTPTTVTYNISVPIGGGAVEGIDFANTTGSVTIPAGELSAPVFIDPTVVGNDTILENPEDVVITLTGVTNTSPDAGADISLASDLSDIEATLTIVDDDFGFVTIDGVDGEEGGANGVFTVTLRDANGNPTTATEDVVVNYSVSGTANEADGPIDLNTEDFAELTGTVTILAGDSTADVVIDINDDTLLEGLEDVTLTLDSVTSDLLPIDGVERVFVGALGGPVISFQQGVNGFFDTSDTFVREGDPLTNFSRDVTVQQDNDLEFLSSNDGVEAGLLRFDDIFGLGFGLIPFGSAIDTASLELTAAGNSGSVALHNLLLDLDFTDITFANALSNGIVGIQADGIEAEISPTATGFVPNFGTGQIDVSASLAAFSAGILPNFGWVFFDTSTTGLLPGSSFLSSESFAPPELTVTLDTSATIHIVDNDTAVVAITDTDAAAEEATDGIVTVTLNGADLPVGYNLTIPYTVGGGGSAIPGSDFAVDNPVAGTESGVITIVGGTNSNTFDVNVLPDFLIEGTENVQVSIGTPTVTAVGIGTTAAQASMIQGLITVGTATDLVDILDDDGATLEVSLFQDGSELPADGLGTHTDTIFRISLTGTTFAGSTSDVDTTVSFTIDTNLIDGSDFIAPTVVDVTIPAFASFVDLEIDILDDLLNEFDHGPNLAEFITLTLTPGSVVGNPGITVSPTDGSATDYIADDDDLIADITATDGEASEVPEHPGTSVQNDGEFTISLNFASDAETIVPFKVTSGSADLPTFIDPVSGNPISPDYELVGDLGIITWTSPTEGFVTFAPSSTPQSTTIEVIATQDFDPTEGNEVVTIEIVDSISYTGPDGSIDLENPNRLPGTPDNVGGAGDSASVNIVDEEYIVSLDNSDSPAQEDGLGGVGFNGQFTVNISNKTQVGNDVTVAFQIESDINVFGINNGSSTDLATFGADYTLAAGTPGSVLTIDPGSIGTDLITGTITIPGGEKAALIDIVVIADQAVEGELDDSVPPVYVENVPLTLVSATSDFGQSPFDGVNIAELGDDVARTETIIDNDASEVTIQVVDDEGVPIEDGGDAIGEGITFDNGAFRFSLNAPVQGRDVVVTYSIVASGTTAELEDHAVINGTITIPAGSTFADLPINPVDDIDVEGNETLTVQIDGVEEVIAGTSDSLPHGQVSFGSDFQDTATILDNDVSTVSINAIDEEATEDGVLGTFQLTLSQPSEIDLIVNYTVGGGTDEAVPGAAPGAGLDYEELSGSILIPAGDTTATIDIEAFEDNLIEGDETVTLTLGSVTDTSGNEQSSVIASGSDEVFIRSNDSTTAVLSSTSNAFEGGEVAGVYTVTIDTPADVDLTFQLENVTPLGVGFATEGADFSTTATVVIPAGQLSGTVTIDPVDDSLAEGNEVLTYRLDSVAAAAPFDFVIPSDDGSIFTVDDVVALDATPVDLTIVDNDTPTFTVNNVALEEGTDGDSTTFEFTITHTGELASDVTITPSLELTTGLTVGGTDFEFTGGSAPSFTFTPADGVSSTRTFTVDVLHDNIHEADEVFTVSLDAVTTGPFVDVSDTGTGTILNDDFVVYVVTPTFPTTFEGTNLSPYTEGGTFSSISFAVIPSIPVDIAIEVDVDYADIGGTFGDPAAFGVDFDAIFAPDGIQFLPFGADFDNGTDSIEFEALSTDGIGVEVRVVQDNIVEGGNGGVVEFDHDGPLVSIFDSEFDSFFTFGYEEFQTVLSSPDELRTGKEFVDTSAFIHDDDSATVTVTATDPDVTEGGIAPFGDGAFTFSVDAPVQSEIEIFYSVTVDGESGDPGNDIENFDSVFTGSIIIPANDNLGAAPITSVTLPFSTIDDVLAENNEDVVITITGLNTDPNVNFNSTPATATIQDNDISVLSFTATDDTATEGGGTATLAFNLTQPSDTPTTFTLDFDGMTSVAENADFTLTLPDGTVINSLPTLLTIPAFVTTYEVTLTAVNDSLTEPTENLDLFITGPVFGNADIEIDTSNDADTVLINDDGDGFKVEITNTSDGLEDDIDGSFTFTLFNSFGVEEALPVGSTPSNAGIEILYALVPASTTATITEDFSFNTGTVTILEGQSTADLTIDVLEDFEVEGNEDVTIVITGIRFVSTANDAVNLGLVNGEEICFDGSEHTVTIVDNDFPSNPAVSGIFVNGTEWSDLFRDRLDGIEDGFGIGYELSDEVSLPWINIDQLIVQFDSAIDASSVDTSDFTLSGIPGFNAGFLTAVIPTIDSASVGPNNTVVLELSQSLEIAQLTLDVNASGITFDGQAGSDTSRNFTALPGDTDQDGVNVNGGDLTDVTLRQGGQIFAGGSFLDYDFFSDVDGNGIINGTDLTAIVDRQSSQLAPTSSSISFSSLSPEPETLPIQNSFVLSSTELSTSFSSETDYNEETSSAKPAAESSSELSLSGSIESDPTSQDEYFEGELNFEEDGSDGFESSKFEDALINDLVKIRGNN